MRSYPCSIDNGAGEVLTFTRRSTHNGIERVEGENLVSPGAGPPMHVHLWQDEVFTVLEGRIGYQRGSDQPAFAGPGETLVFPAGEPHRFWNDGDVPLRCAAYIEPPGNVEFFLEAVFTSTRENGGRPNIFDMAFLTRRYHSEFRMLAIPAPVQRLLFPVIVMIGRALGRYHKYADAPEPITQRDDHRAAITD